MMYISFVAHRACYRELMEEVTVENPLEEIEWSITLSNDPFGNDATHSIGCSVRDALLDADREAKVWEREAKNPKNITKPS